MNFSILKRILKGFVPVLLLGGGLLCLLLFSLISGLFSAWALPDGLMMFLLLVGFNTACAYFFNLIPRLREILSPQKFYTFFVALALGILPKAMAYLSAAGGTLFETPLQAPPVASVMSTFLIVGWEELWFRGIVLDYAARRYTQIGAAAVFSVLFVLLHFLNPDIVLWEAAPDLFLGSMMLCLIYFIFASIWAPIGLHFANNFFESVWPLKLTLSTPTLVATEGIIVLFLLWILLQQKGGSGEVDV